LGTPKRALKNQGVIGVPNSPKDRGKFPKGIRKGRAIWEGLFSPGLKFLLPFEWVNLGPLG